MLPEAETLNILARISAALGNIFNTLSARDIADIVDPTELILNPARITAAREGYTGSAPGVIE